MISEGSRDTEDWSNDAENSALHHMNKLHFYSYFIVFTVNKCSLGEQKRLLSKIFKNLTNLILNGSLDTNKVLTS